MECLTSCEITNLTYLFAFLVLTFSTVITGIEAFKTTSLQYRIALTLETFISLVAGYVYYKYLFNSDNTKGISCCDNEVMQCNDVCKTYVNKEMRTTGYRYIDWFITTPFLLLSLCVILNGTNEFPWLFFGIIVLLNAIMIISGFLAELGRIDKFIGWFIGTIALILMFIIIYLVFDALTQPFFWFFVGLWTLYGIVYFLPYTYKTICYNILDVIAKAGFGIWTWLLAVQLISS